MESWIEIATKVGLPVLGIVTLGWFLGTRVWPWMVKQVEHAQNAREKDLDRFASETGTILKEQTQAIRALADRLERKSR